MNNPGSKAWAHRLVAEHEAGKPSKPTNVYRVAYQALGRVFPEGQQACEQPRSAVVPVGTTKTAVAVPLPKHAPVEHPWWDNEPPSDDGNRQRESLL
ncbi:conserved protein of unknown function [Paraburkholderia dioscoreae]|uniref:Uncharacterized protein n=1 Tax=Paraburkholderia dioscoreae TaxID=2604047 RepID=A0A5Q4Z286_9BURK|nr:conserved protein of unknown function [Paraburkholderia dioscoreae]